MNRNAVLCAAIALAAVIDGNAKASLIGDEIEGFAFFNGSTFSNGFNDTFSPVQPALATVSAGGPEYTIAVASGSAVYSIDIGANSLTLKLDIGDSVADIGVTGFTFEFRDLDWIGTPGIVTGFNLVSSDFVSCPGGVSVQFCLPGDVFPVVFATGFGDDSISLAFSPGPILTYRFNEPFGDKHDFTAEFAILTSHAGAAPIPEPAAIAIFGLGLAGLAFKRRRRTA